MWMITNWRETWPLWVFLLVTAAAGVWLAHVISDATAWEERCREEGGIPNRGLCYEKSIVLDVQ